MDSSLVTSTCFHLACLRRYLGIRIRRYSTYAQVVNAEKRTQSQLLHCRAPIVMKFIRRGGVGCWDRKKKTHCSLLVRIPKFCHYPVVAPIVGRPKF